MLVLSLRDEERAEQLILAIPSLIDPQGCERDFEQLDQVVRAGARMSQILDTATELLVDPVFIAWRHEIESRLGSQRSLDADDIAQLCVSDYPRRGQVLKRSR